MKVSKIGAFVWVIILVGTLLIGCDPPFETQYPFQYARTHVKEIEICSYNGQTEKCTVLKTLSESEIDSIWTDISEITCWDWLGTEWYESEISYGDVFIRITYKSGDQELLGAGHAVRISSDEQELVGRYSFLQPDIYEVIGKYVDTEILKEFSTYFK